MDGESFVTELESARARELDRLGPDGLLLALTDGTREADRVLAAAAASEYAAAETFHAWAADEGDDGARAAFVHAAEQEDEHYERVVDRLDAFDPPSAPGPMHAYLRARTHTIERIATGLIARPVVSLRTHARVVDFLAETGEGPAADLFADLQAETEVLIEVGEGLLETRCTARDWERARATGEYLLQVVAEDHLDTLAALGQEPGANGQGEVPPDPGRRPNT